MQQVQTLLMCLIQCIYNIFISFFNCEFDLDILSQDSIFHFKYLSWYLKSDDCQLLIESCLKCHFCFKFKLNAGAANANTGHDQGMLMIKR